MPTEEASDDALRYARVVPGPRGRVFRAWTNRAEVEAWLAPPPAKAKVTLLDARPGGGFRVEMHEPDGTVHVATGEYLELTPPERLAFTWGWEVEGTPMPAGRVAVELRDLGHQTEVVVVHTRLQGRDAVARHLEGWKGCLASLARRTAEAAPS
jgi:uncharacterized protein YndB with AHSA1/START domain